MCFGSFFQNAGSQLCFRFFFKLALSLIYSNITTRSATTFKWLIKTHLMHCEMLPCWILTSTFWLSPSLLAASSRMTFVMSDPSSPQVKLNSPSSLTICLMTRCKRCCSSSPSNKTGSSSSPLCWKWKMYTVDECRKCFYSFTIMCYTARNL